MKTAWLLAVIFGIGLALVGNARGQTPVAASSLVAPQPLPSASPSPAIAAILLVSDNGDSWSTGPLTVAVGDTVSFMLEPPGVTVPSELTVLVNGQTLQFPSGSPLSFVADKTGIWTVQLDTPGFSSNAVTITAD